LTHTGQHLQCTAGPVGTLLLVYSLYPCFVLPPLHIFRPGAECVKEFERDDTAIHNCPLI